MLEHRQLNAIRTGALIVCAALAAPLAVAAADFPTGTYTMGADHTLSFDGSRFHVNDKDTVLVEGEYTVAGDELRLTDKSGPEACTKEGQTTGAYRWKYAQEGLTLSKIEDACEARLMDLTAKPLMKKK